MSNYFEYSDRDGNGYSDRDGNGYSDRDGNGYSDRDGNVETFYGKVDAADIPHVVKESLPRRVEKLFMFYIIFIVCLIVILYILASYYTDRPIPKETLIRRKKYKQISAQKINFYNPNRVINISNIALVDNHRNIIDIDAKYNYFLKKFKVGNGFLYTIDFGKEIQIADMTIILDSHAEYAAGAAAAILYLDAYDASNTNIWKHSVFLSDTTHIRIAD
jgi:hypothetical protein